MNVCVDVYKNLLWLQLGAATFPVPRDARRVLVLRNPPVVIVQRPMAAVLSCRVAIQCRFHGNPRLRQHRDSSSHPPGRGC